MRIYSIFIWVSTEYLGCMIKWGSTKSGVCVWPGGGGNKDSYKSNLLLIVVSFDHMNHEGEAPLVDELEAICRNHHICHGQHGHRMPKDNVRATMT